MSEIKIIRKGEIRINVNVLPVQNQSLLDTVKHYGPTLIRVIDHVSCENELSYPWHFLFYANLITVVKDL